MRRTKTGHSVVYAVGITILAAAALTGCTREVDVHGYVPNEAALERIQLGVDTKQSIADQLGTPSVVSTFDTQTWYYVSKRTNRVAFFNRNVLDQQIVALHFNDRDQVEQIVRYEIDDGAIIDPENRETPTRGRELGLLEQLLGNAGRVSSQEQQIYGPGP